MSTPLLAHEVEISDGLTLADLKTIDDCHLALLTLARDINRIEEQLSERLSSLVVGPSAVSYEAAQPTQSREWAERAESAIRFKRALRQVVNERVGAIRRAERAAAAATLDHRLVEAFKRRWPAEFEATLEGLPHDHD